jgi:hypothetical protein
MSELDFIWYGYRHKEEQEWVRSRWQTTILVNLQSKKKVKPTDLLKLDCDTRQTKKKVRIMSDEELQEVLKKYENIKPE